VAGDHGNGCARPPADKIDLLGKAVDDIAIHRLFFQPFMLYVRKALS
jgi:hypothetical protein